jgi:cytochrome c-type biogenesis protein CcsB
MMATLLVIFFVAIATATFVEDSYDTITAKKLIFHAWWFKTVLILLCINFIGNIKRYRLLRKEKLSILAIHIGMILTLVGAAVTHYIGFEGIIRLKEGDITNTMWSSEPYFEMMIVDEASGQSYRHPVLLNASEHLNNHFSLNVDPFKKGSVQVEYVDFKSKMSIGAPVDNSENGYNHIEMVFEKMESEYIPEGGYLEKSGNIITYNNPQNGAINITGEGENLTIEFPDTIVRASMDSLKLNIPSSDTLAIGPHPLLKRHLHSFNGLNLVFKAFRPMMERPLVKDDKGENMLTVKLTHNNESKKITIWGGEKMIPGFEPYLVGGETFFLRYGSIEQKLPFSLRLDDFVLETYPGSDRHSGYRSEVTVFENGKNPMNEPGESHSIFMNNVLDQDGYRVFQSSYDNIDGKEVAVFSVNNDFWGTLITYIAYLLLSLGFIVTLFNKSSRFVELLQRLIKLNKKERNMTVLVALLFSLSGFSQEYKYTPVSQEHCDKFNELLVLSYTGRIEPCNSLAFDLIRKLTRKDSWKLETEGIKLSPEQFMLDMFVDPGFWSRQPIMKFDANTGLGKDLGVTTNYLAFTDIVDVNNDGENDFIQPKVFQKKSPGGEEVYYTFDSLVKWAEMKPLAERNSFDKEVLKLNEKVSIFWQTTQGELLRIIPRNFDGQEVWMNWFDPQAEVDLSAGALGADVVVSASTLIRGYLNELLVGKQTGDYSGADFMLEKLKEYQRALFSSDPGHLPSEGEVKLEVAYNQWNIFNHLKYIYLLLGLILLPLTLVKSLSEHNRKGLNLWINIFIGIFIVSFLAHMTNLGLRWYIIGHAPWSDGYEALTFIAWACILAGILFIRLSPIVTGATALLAFFILMTAGHSKYDPQMSNLEPVLKSYWLVIHVACLTISYGFFGLGFILSLINMNIFAFRSGNSIVRSEKTVTVLTYVNEMTLTIGLVLATIGTFLGGVWANESWGRYWGWDAKETWALVIVLVYAFILHMRFVPGLRGKYGFNLASAIGFSSVLFTFIGVNYYLTKGLHSYARGDAPAFPIWVWVLIACLIALFALAGIKESKNKNILKQNKS